jgi:uncharacterized protein (DUF1330 family)
MPAFIVATVTIVDQAKFAAYGAAIRGLADEFGGEYLVRGAVETVLEGHAAVGERVVILRFPDAAAARRFYDSDAYQAARALREGAADIAMRLVVG